VSGPIHRRLAVLLVSAAAGFGVWKFAPGTKPDRLAFTAVARGFANPPLFVSGEGTHADPWQLRMFRAVSKPDPQQAPLIVSLGDDPDGFFQSSPPAPIDLAVVFSNFHRLGATKAASAAVLAWEAPDVLGLAALEKSLGRFDSLVTAAPLSRGALASPIPPAFRRASLPLDAVRGDLSVLPVVNRSPIPDVVLGGENAAAGFSVLESEPRVALMPLMARWDDRMVFAFPLLTVLQRLELKTEDLEIRLGEYLKFGAEGPIVRIDRYGRLASPLKPLSAYTEISAEALIDGGDELFPKQAPDPVILRDDRSGADPNTRAFSRDLSAGIAALASEGGMAEIRAYPRLAANWEIGTLVALVVLLCGISAGKLRLLGPLVLVGVIFSAQWVGLGMAGVWLPGLALLAAVLVALAFAAWPGQPARSLPEPEPESEPEPEPEPAPAPEPTAPAKKAAKKAAAKKTPSKKATPRSRKKPEDPAP
jgi:hypothetical protein